MIAKTAQKIEAIKLRKQGLSYSEILKKIAVSQSSLTLWLSGIKLTPSQEKRLIKKGDAARKLGSGILKKYRILDSQRIIRKAASEIKVIDKKDLMLIGTTLYWGEGSKQKDHNPSTGVIFSNSDPMMIRVYLKWLSSCLNIPENRIVFEIYIHETYRKSREDLGEYWSKITGFSTSSFEKIYFKKNKVRSFRKNRGNNYWGVLRIKVRKSTDLNRRVIGWIKGICVKSGVAS